MMTEEEEEEEEIMEEEMLTITTALPQEILMEILSWLPAKSLVSSFNFVCKAWRTLIHNPVFIKMHLNQGAINGVGGGRNSDDNNNNNNNNNSLIRKSGKELFQLHPPFNFESIPPIPIVPIKLDFHSLSSDSRLVGSCNGLLCISFATDETIILLNPSTRKFKVSPKQPVECPPKFSVIGAVTYGFGCCYDSAKKIDEYKVIRIMFFSSLDNGKRSSRSQLDIYSMSSNSWRREASINEYPYVISNQQSGVLVNGALHWMGTCTLVMTSSSWDTIVSFDIRNEEFRQVPIPLACDPTVDDPYFPKYATVLMNMKGCLAIIHFFDGNYNMDADMEIWVMKEFGIKESWTKEFVIRSLDIDSPWSLPQYAISSRSNAYVLKGDQILIEGLAYMDRFIEEPFEDEYKKLILYDINKRKIDWDFKMMSVPDEPHPHGDQVDYIETLVSLKSSIMAEEEIIMGEMWSTLPQGIIYEILSWLPVKSLISKFKFVCKAWRTLIHDPEFVKMHLNRGTINGGGKAISHNSNHSLIFKTGNELFQLHPCFNYEGLPIAAARKLDFDLSSSSSRLVGSCNGLLCISFSPDESIILLNPSTRKYKVLPKESIECPSQFESHDPVTYGFGCCHNSTTTTTTIDEYMVVRIAYFYPPVIIDICKDPSFRFQIDIYSMSSNSWRRKNGIKGIPYLISEQRTAIFVSGALHWMGLYDPGYGYNWDVLLSFDIGDEEFQTLPWPPCGFGDVVNEDGILMNLKGCLGMIYVHTRNMDIEIWVMKEYGISESWTRECVIRSSDTDPPRALSGFSISWRSTVCCLKGDQILINEGYGRLALYDMNTKKIDGDFKIVGVPDAPRVDQGNYIETLVSLKSSLLLLSNNRKRKNCS